MSIKHETITVSGNVIYCDDCGKRGPESAYDNINDTYEQADMEHWILDADHDQCPDCAAKASASVVAKRRA